MRTVILAFETCFGLRKPVPVQKNLNRYTSKGQIELQHIPNKDQQL